MHFKKEVHFLYLRIKKIRIELNQYFILNLRHYNLDIRNGYKENV